MEERGRVDTLWVSREEERDRLIGAIEVAATCCTIDSGTTEAADTLEVRRREDNDVCTFGMEIGSVVTGKGGAKTLRSGMKGPAG